MWLQGSECGRQAVVDFMAEMRAMLSSSSKLFERKY
jgi:hypothetical protein